jgi:MFS family permease
MEIMTDNAKNPINNPKVISAAIIGSGLGAMFYNVLPLYLGMAQEYRELSNQEIGIIGTVFFLGFNLATMFGFFWVRRFNWRLIAAIAAPLAALSIGSGAFLQNYQMLLVSVFVAGGAFSVLYGLCATVLGDADNAARWYGVKMGWEAATGALLFIFLPPLVIHSYGFNGLVIAMAVVLVILSPFLIMLPVKGTKNNDGYSDAATSSERFNTPRIAIFAMLLAVAFWFCGQTVVWSFVERIGDFAGHANKLIGIVLASTLGFALLGSLTAVALGDRVGRLKPFMASSAIYLVSLPVLMRSADFIAFTVGACLLMFSVGLGSAYIFSIVSEMDNDGRYTILVVPAIGLGAMFAPGIAGYLSSGGGYTSMLVFGAILVAVAVVLASVSARLAKSFLAMAKS